jgi:beta-barrel assembly-enhancing protease
MQFSRETAKRVSQLTAFLLLVTQCYAASTGPQLPNPGTAPMTRQQQIQVGLEIAAQVYKKMPVLPDDSPETQYIRQLGEKLEAVIPAKYSWPFQFHVIPQKEINAFALPGGQMFVNAGTIAAASNEAELAGVMAHEMAHVYMQHGAKQAGKTQTTSLIAGLAGALLGATTGGVVGQLAQAGIQFGAQGVILKYSRADEAQADAVGAIILYKAGYNPRALADFFKKLDAQDDSGPQFLNDHPNPGNREQAIKQEIASWPPKNYTTNSAAFEKVRLEAASLKVYSAQQISQGAKSGDWARLNQKDGAVFAPPAGYLVNTSASADPQSKPGAVSLKGVLPSGKMWTTDVGPVRMSCPSNWDIRTPAQDWQDIQIAPAAGVSDKGIGYGMVLNQVRAQSRNIDDVTSQIVRLLQRSGSGLKPIGKAQPITVAGIQGRTIDMESASPFPDDNGQPQKERDWLVTVPRPDGSVVYFVFVAPQAQFDRFRPTFDAMLRSIKFR